MTPTNTIELPYGDRPLAVELPEGAVVRDLPPGRSGGKLPQILDQALDRPVDSARLEELAAGARRVCVIVSDSTRDDPRRELVDAVRRRLHARAQMVVAVANGTHAPADLGLLGLPDALLEGAVNHDSRDHASLVELGVTRRGTPVRVNRCLVDCDLVIAAGRIKPHYFAGYGAGAKAIFPGLGGAREIRINHELKASPGALPGVVDGNPCRDDLEEAARMVPTPSFLLNAICDADGHPRSAVAGDVVAAFREGARRCAPMFRVMAPRSRAVIVSDHLPLTGILYQASKLAAAAAPLLEPGGLLVIVAQCPLGIGPIDVVNRAIYDIGIKPRLPANARIVLVSDLPPGEVERSYCEPAARVEDALATVRGENPVVLPRAGTALIEVSP